MARVKVVQWLRPRIKWVAGEATAWMTIYALPYRCWKHCCREESLAVVAYRLNREDAPRSRGPGQTSAYWDTQLDLVS